MLTKNSAASIIDVYKRQTFGGNPLATAAALAVLKIFDEENLVENSKTMGEYFLKRLMEIKNNSNKIKQIRGKGLMVGIESVSYTHLY